MVATSSTMLALGTSAPKFSLYDVCSDSYYHSPEPSKNSGLLIAFICNHCPYVLHLLGPLVNFCETWKKCGVDIYFISSNDVEKYPQDSPECMANLAKEHKISFPYLYDPEQAVAKSYKAACTPDFFLFNSEHKLYYRGQFDNSRPGNNVAVSGNDLSFAVQSMLNREKPPKKQNPSLGCNLKWKSGNEPDYFLSPN